MLIGTRQAGFRATRAQSTLQSACATRGWLFSLSPWRQWRIHLLHIFKTRYLILQHASQIGSPFPFLPFQDVSFLFCFVLSPFKRSILLRAFSQKLKSSFQAPKVFAVFALKLARWISPGQSTERKGFWRDFWRPGSSSCLSASAVSPRYRLPKRLRIKCKLRSRPFKKHQWGPCGEAALL